MNTNSKSKKQPPSSGLAKSGRTREQVMADVCEQLEKGLSLERACKVLKDARPTTVLDWIEKYPPLAEQYTRARSIGYRLLADEIVSIADETSAEVEVQEVSPDGDPVFNADGTPLLKTVRVPLGPDVIARNRLRVDTRKWMLSKMLPKIYGDKVTQEHTGAGGGPITLAALDLKNMSDGELAQMQALLSKASGQ